MVHIITTLSLLTPSHTKNTLSIHGTDYEVGDTIADLTYTELNGKRVSVMNAEIKKH